MKSLLRNNKTLKQQKGRLTLSDPFLFIEIGSY